MGTKKEENALVFETTIPVFSWFITKVMGILFLVPVAILGAIAALSVLNGGRFSDVTPDIYFALGFTGLVFFLTYIVMAVMFPHGFVSKIQINQEGVSQASLSATKKVHRAAIIGGILTKSPGAIGTGLSAEAGDNRFISWDDMGVVKVNARSRYMYFSRGRMKMFPIGFFCPEHQYEKTAAFIAKHFPLEISR